MSELQTRLDSINTDSDLPELKSGVEFLAFLIRAVNSIEDLDSVLRVLMDGAITLVGAARGFILLKDTQGKLEFKVARGVKRSELSLEDFQVSRTLIKQVVAEGKPVLMDNASAQVGSVSAIGFNLLSIMAAPLKIGDKIAGVVYLDNPFKRGVFSEADLELISTLAEHAALVVRRAALQHEQHRLKGFLDRYVSPQVAQALMANKQSHTLSGRTANVTILFADISGFTPLAEQLDPGQVLELLNRHFSNMVQAIFANGGTVKQFAGDEIMAIFGAPAPFKDHAVQGVKAALAMQRANAAWQSERSGQGEPTFGLKIGLHCGSVVVGSVGSADRMEYAAVGDVVNTAARVMSLSSRFQRPTCILASSEIVNASPGVAQAELLGEEQVKGRQATVSVYALHPSEGAGAES